MADINNPREYLEGLLNAVDARDNAKDALDKSTEQKRQLNAQLSSLSDAIAKEKNEIIRRRKIDLEASYDKQIRSAKTEIKKIEDERQKALDRAIKERTIQATKSTLEAVANDEKSFKAYASAQKLPVFMRTRAYFSLFCPDIAGYIGLFAIFLILLVISLLGIRANYLGGGWPLVFFIVLLVIVLAALVVYVLIWTNTRVKYRDQINTAKEILKRAAGSKKTARDIEKNIRKAGDDQSYGLESFDRELSEKNAAKANIEAKKADALSNFENEIKNKLSSDIDANHKEEIDALNTRIAELESTISEAGRSLSEQEALLSSDYVAHLGAENLTHETALRLLSFVDDGSATTVSQAVAKLKEPENK